MNSSILLLLACTAVAGVWQGAQWEWVGRHVGDSGRMGGGGEIMELSGGGLSRMNRSAVHRCYGKWTEQTCMYTYMTITPHTHKGTKYYYVYLNSNKQRSGSL